MRAKLDYHSDEKPKSPKSAYMMWLSTVWEQIESETQGWPYPAIYKKAGQMWMALEDKSEWLEKAAAEKQKYEAELILFNAKNGTNEEAE